MLEQEIVHLLEAPKEEEKGSPEQHSSLPSVETAVFVEVEMKGVSRRTESVLEGKVRNEGEGADLGCFGGDGFQGSVFLLNLMELLEEAGIVEVFFDEGAVQLWLRQFSLVKHY